MTDDGQLTELEALAWAIAVCAPIRQTVHTTEARIPWRLIHATREALDKRGYDWRRAVQEQHGRL